MKRTLIIVCAVACLTALLASCTPERTPTPTPTPTAEPTPTPEPTPEPDADLARTGTATAFRSLENCGPEKAIDGDPQSCWSTDGVSYWSLDLGKPVTFNTVAIRFMAKSERWSIQYFNESLGKYIDVPGCVRNYQAKNDEIHSFEFHIYPFTAQKLQFNLYEGGPETSIFDFNLYYREGQDPVDGRNSYMSARRERVYPEINVGPTTDLFGILPASTYAGSERADWTVSIETDASKLTFDNSKWCKGLDEISVFDTQITHVQKNDSSLNWTMRVGLGGQIYSLETAVGEIIPPQNSHAEWMDEVWQIVSVADARMYDRSFTPATHFIHQAGMYKQCDMETAYGPKHMTDDTFFSPRLAQKWDEQTATLSLLNLGVTPTINMSRSDLLYYTDIADKGDGIIEITYGLSNYAAKTNLSFFNFPWGGVRYSIFKDFFVAKDGGYLKVDPHDQTVFLYKEMDGWFAYTQDMNDPDSFTVAFVGGDDTYDDGSATSKNGKHVGKVQAYYTGDPVRDYYVLQTISGRTVRQHDTYVYRYYVVMGKLSDVKQKAPTLVDKVVMGFVRNEEATTGTTAIYRSTDDGKAILTAKADGDPLFHVYSQTIEGAKPLYLLYDTTADRYIVSVDPYILSAEIALKDIADVTVKPYSKYADLMIKDVADGRTEYMGILGFVMLEDNVADAAGYVHLSEILDKDLFPGTGLDDAAVLVKVSNPA